MVMKKKRLETGAVQICIEVERPFGSQRTKNTAVKVKKLWMSGHPALGFFCKNRKSNREQEILQNLHIIADDFGIHSDIPGDRSQTDRLRLGKTGVLQKSGEAFKISCK